MEPTLLPKPDIVTESPSCVGILSILEPVRLDSGAALPSPGDSSRKPVPEPASPHEAIPFKRVAAAWHLPVPPGPYLAAALERRWQSYRKQLRLCREDFSEEAVHELRVATRRLLAHLVLLGDLAPSVSLEKARRSLKRRLAELGDLRDAQVQRKFLDQLAGRFPEADLLRLWLESRERRLVKGAVRLVKGTRTKKLEKRFSTMAQALISGQRRSHAQKRLAAAAFRATNGAFAEAVKRRQAIDTADMRTVHQTRVAFKRFRYMVESLSPGLTKLSKRQLRPLAYYQRRMGIIQDLEVIQRCVRQFTNEHNGSEAKLRRFSGYLSRRRTRALLSFMKRADAIFEFWPPKMLAGSGGR